jgi:hypothetical protein
MTNRPCTQVAPLCAADDAPSRPHPADLAAFARTIIAQRRSRDRILGPDLFGEPIWDMLLDLFAHTEEGKPVTISNLCIASGASGTTALRHISALVKRGLLLRHPDPHDRRRVLIQLSPDMHRRLEQLLSGWMSNG